MRKLLAPLVGAFLLLGSPFALAGECNQGTAAEFKEMIASDAEAKDLFVLIAELGVSETSIALSVINPNGALTDEKFETSLWALRKDGRAFLIPMVGGQICGMFNLTPEGAERVMQALQGKSA